MMAETYLATNKAFSDFCREYAEGGLGQTSDLLRTSLECQSNQKHFVYYVCELRDKRAANDEGHLTLVLESCNYSLDTQKMSCENNSVVTTFDE